MSTTCICASAYALAQKAAPAAVALLVRLEIAYRTASPLEPLSREMLIELGKGRLGTLADASLDDLRLLRESHLKRAAEIERLIADVTELNE